VVLLATEAAFGGIGKLLVIIWKFILRIAALLGVAW
jgi:hypothetical protein